MHAVRNSLLVDSSQLMERRSLLRLGLSAMATVALPLSADAAPTVGMAVRRLRLTLGFSNPLDRSLEEQQFWCYIPADLGDGQNLRSLEVTAPYRLLTDPLGHRILALSFDRVAPMARKMVGITVELGMDDTGRRGAAPAPGAWLGAERFIETDHPELRTLAASLRASDDIGTARAIYDWVRQNLDYAGYIADDLGALAALRSRRGDCTEYADLVVALARATGIAARMMGGYVAEQDMALRASDYHNWAELYLGGAWRVVDAQKEGWLAPSDQYIVFRVYTEAPTNPVGRAHRYRLQGELQVSF